MTPGDTRHPWHAAGDDSSRRRGTGDHKRQTKARPESDDHNITVVSTDIGQWTSITIETVKA